MSTAAMIDWQVLPEVDLYRVADRTLAVVKRDPHYRPAFDTLVSKLSWLGHDKDLEVCALLVCEALKFLSAAATPGKPRMVPGRLVDAAWHALILDTRLYESICRQMGVGFIHHNPDPESSGWNKPGVYEGTIGWMSELGFRPNRMVWGKSMAEYCADHEPEGPDDDPKARCSSCSGG